MKKLVGDVVAVVKHFKQRESSHRRSRLGRRRGLVYGHVRAGQGRPADRAQPSASPRPRTRTGKQPEAAGEQRLRPKFQEPDAHKSVTADGLASWVRDPEARAKYVDAFQRSDIEAMLHYYKQNYPR